MKISRLIIKNYRNLKDIDICLGETVVLVGENNSGKSNLLRAVTLPFLTDESSFSGKSLSWIDINDTAKEKYYHYIIENQKSIVDGTIKCSDFIKEMPVVRVEVQLKADVTENYFVKDLSYSVENGELMYGLRYEYKPSKAEEIFKLVKHVLMQETVDEFSIKKVKMNLLPTEFYAYSITVPDKGSVAYDTLKLYKYTALEAERDEFSRTKERLGSKSLVKVLQIINNVKQLKLDFKECAAQMGGIQMSMIFEPKTAVFSIPDMEVYKYSEVKQRQFMRLNAYLGYTNEFITDRTRSTPERLFEKYCETRADRIAWVYKNGDKGQQYLSIVYLDGFSKQWLFYPDYIVKTIDGQVWLIETKGGEVAGHSKNLDAQVSNKFIAFKQYAEKYKLNFGFVRDINEDLFINNTKYHEDMSHESWRPLSDLL